VAVKRLTSSIVLLASVALLGGCPRRFDSRADPIPSTTDPVVEREYREARARLEAGDAADAAAKYAAFASAHPEDLLARSAKIGEARARTWPGVQISSSGGSGGMGVRRVVGDAGND
jgi:outer membrane protein assembly factor BamD (BamD/ComL family)